MRFSKKPKFKKTRRYFNKLDTLDPKRILEEYGRIGVKALSAATPNDTGETSQSWSYKVEGNRERYTITWSNSVQAGSVPLVVILQYGHATKSGYFISGVDFINPALRPVYDSLVHRLRQEVLG
ncbi:MAG: HK97 gp10 family phage protein [Chloroflexi bacterium]|nr:MAG: HK97 gp10 family phage protein [Chloroflexota bacterium]